MIDIVINKGTIFCIVGESGSGKTTVVNQLVDKYGLTSIDSYTTRPKRFPEETGHIFISEDEFDNLKDLVAYTKFNGYRYCATAQQVDVCDLYVVDKAGVETLKELYKGSKQIRAIYIDVPKRERLRRMTEERGKEAAELRIAHDRLAFMGIEELVDFTVLNDNLDQCVKQIYAIIKSFIYRRLNVGVDIDNVLNNLTEEWAKYLNKKYRLKVKLEDIVDYDMTKAYPTLTRKQIFKPLYKSKIWKRLRPLEDSVKYLRELNQNHDLVLITSTHPDTVADKFKYIRKFFPFIQYEQLVIAHNKQQYKVDILIDDYQDNLIGGDYFKILLDYAWNHNVDCELHNIKRVHSFKEAFNVIQSLSRL